jgi:hypothetical protein
MNPMPDRPPASSEQVTCSRSQTTSQKPQPDTKALDVIPPRRCRADAVVLQGLHWSEALGRLASALGGATVGGSLLYRALLPPPASPGPPPATPGSHRCGLPVVAALFAASCVGFLGVLIGLAVGLAFGPLVGRLFHRLWCRVAGDAEPAHSLGCPAQGTNVPSPTTIIPCEFPATPSNTSRSR